ncbi:hypothetical protein ONS95_008018 [Cadophora gregata]|uniref:uncharacterized protein n=1 Tax=Cadophora gregata TaxID=51156 RepID=UPI0026DD086F|nr:uncharacterized protein ONS95_008018 [Cadophora gregata]KAK0119160.1 hypothetical protein ONS96_012224 [Cadophora gregata f. sp. sojae]KAK0126417.1 hypothetical protein ONS95_008018 [Cadophora gregata]
MPFHDANWNWIFFCPGLAHGWLWRRGCGPAQRSSCQNTTQAARLFSSTTTPGKETRPDPISLCAFISLYSLLSVLEHDESCILTIFGSRGEKTAQALESNLTSLEKKIDDLLASFEESERAKVDEANGKQGKEVGGIDGKGEKA